MKSIDALIKRLARVHLLSSQIEKTLVIIGEDLVTSIKLGMPSKFGKYTTKENGFRPTTTGHLRNSIRAKTEHSDKLSRVEIGSYGVLYNAIHEFGGVIRPKNAKSLTIPLQRWSEGRSARSFNNLLRVGNILYDMDRVSAKNRRAGKLPNSAKAYLLRKFVTIKEKRYMRDGINNAMPTVMRRINNLLNIFGD